MSLAEMIRKGPRVRRATATVATDTGPSIASVASVATVAAEISPNSTSLGMPPMESIVEPASRTARMVYWEDPVGNWHGPVQPEYLGRTKVGSDERFWIIVEYKGTMRWIWAESLRSRQAFMARQAMGSPVVDVRSYKPSSTITRAGQGW